MSKHISKIFLVILFFLVPFLRAQTPGGTTINGLGGPFTFTGSGVSCTGYVCTFSGGGSGAVTSVFTRTGDVVAESGDYNAYYLGLSGGTVTGGLTIAPSATGAVPLTVNTPSGSTADLQDWGAAGLPKIAYINQYGYLNIQEVEAANSLTILSGAGKITASVGPNSKIYDFDVLSGWTGTATAGTVVAGGTTTHSVVACAISCTNAFAVVDSNPNSNAYIQTIGSHSVNLDGTYTVTGWEYACASPTTAGTVMPSATLCPTGEQIGYVTTPATSVTTATIFLQFK